MKVGDLVKKVRNDIAPEDKGVIGIITIIIKKSSCSGGNPDFVKVQLPHGERLWRISDMELVSEAR